ncbi:hypothetical protein POTOM_054869 [Populus tomentosa]|uniref:Nodulin-like domain-containing protein n=1 Tax=Populus tomentosa TaxID=118781 RepID=A0A8X7XWC8_POPTO|nr:hypothetical protein POTOM_054869 [Populus tomentosa]
MMGKLPDRFSGFINNRWLVFVAAMWIQSCAGIGYLFGSISPVIKSSLNYSQRQLASLGVAKDLGDSVGFLAGSLSEILPLWGALLVGAVQSLVGYGWVWLVVTGRAPVLPLWAELFYLNLVGNGSTAFISSTSVCAHNFDSYGKDVGPAMVIIALMFIVRPVGDLVDLSRIVVIIFTIVLFVLVLIPIVIPLSLSFFLDPRGPAEEPLLPEPPKQEPGKSGQETPEVIFSEVEDEKPKEVDLLPASERQKRIAQLQAKLFQAAAEGAVTVKRRRGPHRGEDFTLMQALIKADSWLIFFSLLLGSGSGLTVIDNLGQMSQSLGDYAYPRPVAMAIAQLVMAVGHVFFAFGWPGAMYIGTLLIGLGYGAHWAIVPAAASELFGLKKFGALYSFLTLANPAGSLVFSGLIASSIYDREAERQAHGNSYHIHNGGSFFSGMLGLNEPSKCEDSVCYFLTSMIMSGFCVVAVVLSLILVHRTKIVYANLYGKSRS